MAEATGGTSGDSGDAGSKEEKTFTQADIDKAVADGSAQAAKDARADEYRKSQSQIDTAKASATKANTALDEFRRTQISALPEEEKQKAMVEDLWKRLNEPTATVDPAPKPEVIEDPSTSAAEIAQKAQEQMRTIAKEEGLDPTKLDFSSEKAFMHSIVAQRKEETEEKDPNGGPVDTGSHTVGKANADLRKTDPASLISGSRKDWKPVRGPQHSYKP